MVVLLYSLRLLNDQACKYMKMQNKKNKQVLHKCNFCRSVKEIILKKLCIKCNDLQILERNVCANFTVCLQFFSASIY